MFVKLTEIIQLIEQDAPLQIQESYDNSGLLVGNKEAMITKAIIALDLTETVMSEAIENNCDLIITHHPFIFTGIKKITGNSSTERLIVSAIQHNIAIYAAHTNLDNAANGMNKVICDQLQLINTQILRPIKGILRKLVVFCPHTHASDLRNALFEAGAGKIGNYDSCSFNTQGEGTFRGNITSKPFVGKAGTTHHEPETRIETVFPAYLEKPVLSALFKMHPYEEMAYDIYTLENNFNLVGAGMLGELPAPLSETEFLTRVKTIFRVPFIKHSGFTGRKIKKIAVCGGSGSFLIQDAIAAKAQAFVTADIKYHQFQQAENHLIIADAGHYETEQFIKNHLLAKLNKYFPTFAVLLAKTCSNSINYF